MGWGGSILPKGRPYGTLRGARVSTMLYGDVTTIYIRALRLKPPLPSGLAFGSVLRTRFAALQAAHATALPNGYQKANLQQLNYFLVIIKLIFYFYFSRQGGDPEGGTP